MKIGVLALQGDFAEHTVMLERLEVTPVEVRLAKHLDGLDGLIIPGGESTTIGKLAVDFGLMEPLRAFGKSHAVWGTCAGAIFLSKDVRRHQPLLGIMDITVERNAFGRSIRSKLTSTLRRLKKQPGRLHLIMRCSSARRSSNRSAGRQKSFQRCRMGALSRHRKANCWQPLSILNSPKIIVFTIILFRSQNRKIRPSSRQINLFFTENRKTYLKRICHPVHLICLTCPHFSVFAARLSAWTLPVC
jgi:hypothetical protein